MLLLDGVVGDTNGAQQELHGRVAQQNGIYSAYCWTTGGTDFDSGRAVVEVSPDGGTNWFIAKQEDGAQAIFTQADVLTIVLKGGHVRGVLENTAGDANDALSLQLHA